MQSANDRARIFARRYCNDYHTDDIAYTSYRIETIGIKEYVFAREEKLSGDIPFSKKTAVPEATML